MAKYKRYNKKKQKTFSEQDEYEARHQAELEELQEGKVTKIAVQKKNKDRVSVFLDENFAFGLSQEIVFRNMLCKDQILSVEKQKEMIKADWLYRAKQSALEYVAYKARTEHEVRNKLRQKRFLDEVIDEVISRFKELGYLNDENYASAFAKGRLRSKGHGPRRISQDLRKRGISKELISEVIEEVNEGDAQREAALQHAEKRWSRLAKERDPYKRKKKLFDFLSRRGFNFDLIKSVVDEVTNKEVEDDFEVGEPEPVDEEALIREAEQKAEEERAEAMKEAEKRWNRLSSESNTFKRKKKLFDFLARRGFNFDLIKEVVSEVSQQP